MKYKHSVIGGTFDRLHAGHKRLINEAFSDSQKVTIGITSSKLFDAAKASSTIEGYNARLFSVKRHLETGDYLNRSLIVEINDIYGPTATDSDFDAIYTTEENIKNVKKINEKRKKNGLKALEVIVIPYVFGDDQKIISSSRIRNGEIDREGNSYFELLALKKRYKLPDELRGQLQKPFGKVIKNLTHIEKIIDMQNLTIAVGDIATVNLYKQGLQADISIIDHKTRRRTMESKEMVEISVLERISEIHETVNEPGMIERRAVGVIRKALQVLKETSRKQLITVYGEEDLLTIPAVLLSPLESIVLYGQPDQGLVSIHVSEKKKRDFVYLLNKMR